MNTTMCAYSAINFFQWLMNESKVLVPVHRTPYMSYSRALPAQIYIFKLAVSVLKSTKKNKKKSEKAELPW